MAETLSSISVVLVCGANCPPQAILEALSERLESLFLDFEYIIVANDVAPAVALELKALSETLPDSLIVFLGDRVHDDLARLIGIDHAVSDYVLFATPTAAEVDSLPLIAGPLRDGCDLVLGRAADSTRRGGLNRLLFTAFQALFRLVAGRVFEDEPAAPRILSRAAALYVATRRDGEVLVRARTLNAGFPAAEIALPGTIARRERGSLRRDLARAARFIATGSTLLLRASTYLALVSGIGSAIYALYALAIYLLVADVEPGWTTLSLQLAGMTLLFSIQFLLLSEHVIQMAGIRGPTDRRHLIIRELRSRLSRRSARLNIAGLEGRYRVAEPGRDGR